MTKILIVEDEPDLAEQLADWFRRDRYSVDIAADGLEALNYVCVYKYDLVLLDWMLPVLEGIDVLKRLRERKVTTPVIMLTSRQSIADKEAGLNLGADDYITKPCSLRELSARVRAAIRRASNITENELTYMDITLDPMARVVTKSGERVHLEPKEFNLLEFFMRHPRQTFSAEAIMDRVWPSESIASPDAIRTYIKMLRRKLDSKGKSSIIQTVRGVGYKFAPEETVGN